MTKCAANNTKLTTKALSLAWIFLLTFSLVMTVYSPAVLAEGDVISDTAAALGIPSTSQDAKPDSETKAVPVINGETTNNEKIESHPNPQKDRDIHDRISGIFSEIDGLQAVTIRVNQGVVRLGGETPNEKKAQQAINITNRLTDVVTVEDRISRTLDVQDNVSSVFNGLKHQAQTLVKALPLLIVGIIIFILVASFGSWLSGRQALWQRIAPNPFVAELLSQTVKIIFVIFGLILGLSLIGAETILGTLLGGAGVIGIAVGFAIKDTIENYIASMMLSIRQPFRACDHIKINGQEGIVVRLTPRATILMTLDGNQLRIPNAEVFKGTILNYTKNPERRFSFQLGINSNDDPLAAMKVGLEAIRSLDFVLEKPKAVAIIVEVGEASTVLEFLVWVDQSTTDFTKARSIAIREAKHAIENEGFNLPEPVYRLRFNKNLEKSLEQLPKWWSQNNTVTLPEIDSETLDEQAKQQARARSKHVLSRQNNDDVLDARNDNKLLDKVKQEIANTNQETDLLNKDSPQE